MSWAFGFSFWQNINWHVVILLSWLYRKRLIVCSGKAFLDMYWFSLFQKRLFEKSLKLLRCASSLESELFFGNFIVYMYACMHVCVCMHKDKTNLYLPTEIVLGVFQSINIDDLEGDATAFEHLSCAPAKLAIFQRKNDDLPWKKSRLHEHDTKIWFTWTWHWLMFKSRCIQSTRWRHQWRMLVPHVYSHFHNDCLFLA